MEMKITNECFEYVHLSLDSYNEFNRTINRLSKMYKDEKESKKEIEDKVTELTCQLEILKEELLDSRLMDYRIENQELKEVTKIGEWNYGLDDVDHLLKLGFTIDEMNEFITKKWNEYHSKESEESENE